LTYQKTFRITFFRKASSYQFNQYQLRSILTNMNMERLGVKYCGGCNPCIDRSRLVCEIKKLLPQGLNLTADGNSSPWDIGIMVCGCHVACADKQEIRNLARRWIVVAGCSLDLEAMPEEKMAQTVVRKIIDPQQ
jgi:hypothetical protein